MAAKSMHRTIAGIKVVSNALVAIETDYHEQHDTHVTYTVPDPLVDILTSNQPLDRDSVKALDGFLNTLTQKGRKQNKPMHWWCYAGFITQRMINAIQFFPVGSPHRETFKSFLLGLDNCRECIRCYEFYRTMYYNSASDSFVEAIDQELTKFDIDRLAKWCDSYPDLVLFESLLRMDLWKVANLAVRMTEVLEKSVKNDLSDDFCIYPDPLLCDTEDAFKVSGRPLPGIYWLCVHSSPLLRQWAQSFLRRFTESNGLQVIDFKLVMLPVFKRFSVMITDTYCIAAYGLKRTEFWNGLAFLITLLPGEIILDGLLKEIPHLIDLIWSTVQSEATQNAQVSNIFRQSIRCIDHVLRQAKSATWTSISFLPKFVLDDLHFILLNSKELPVQKLCIEVLDPFLESLGSYILPEEEYDGGDMHDSRLMFQRVLQILSVDVCEPGSSFSSLIQFTSWKTLLKIVNQFITSSNINNLYMSENLWSAKLVKLVCSEQRKVGYFMKEHIGKLVEEATATLLQILVFDIFNMEKMFCVMTGYKISDDANEYGSEIHSFVLPSGRRKYCADVLWDELCSKQSSGLIPQKIHLALLEIHRRIGLFDSQVFLQEISADHSNLTAVEYKEVFDAFKIRYWSYLSRTCGMPADYVKAVFSNVNAVPGLFVCLVSPNEKISKDCSLLLFKLCGIREIYSCAVYLCTRYPKEMASSFEHCIRFLSDYPLSLCRFYFENQTLGNLYSWMKSLIFYEIETGKLLISLIPVELISYLWEFTVFLISNSSNYDSFDFENNFFEKTMILVFSFLPKFFQYLRICPDITEDVLSSQLLSAVFSWTHKWEIRGPWVELLCFILKEVGRDKSIYLPLVSPYLENLSILLNKGLNIKFRTILKAEVNALGIVLPESSEVEVINLIDDEPEKPKIVTPSDQKMRKTSRELEDLAFRDLARNLSGETKKELLKDIASKRNSSKVTPRKSKRKAFVKNALKEMKKTISERKKLEKQLRSDLRVTVSKKGRKDSNILKMVKPKTLVRPNQDINALETKTVGEIPRFDEEILSWQPNDISIKVKDEVRLKLNAIPTHFSTFRSYQRAFAPLLIEEARASIEASLDDLMDSDFEEDTDFRVMRYVSCFSKQKTICRLDFSSVGKTQESLRFYTGDLILLFPQDSINANTEEFARKRVKKGKAIFATVDIDPGCRRLSVYCSTSLTQSYQFHKHSGRKWIWVKVTSLVTLLRELEALNSLSSIYLRKYILAEKKYKSSSLKNIDDKLFDQTLNFSQREAVIKSVGSAEPGFTLIQGPPGTGKTKTIVSIVKVLLELSHRSSNQSGGWKKRSNPDSIGKHILICAPSNAAVDELCSRLESVIPQQFRPDKSGRRLEGFLFRVGSGVNPNSPAANYSITMAMGKYGDSLQASSEQKEQLLRLRKELNEINDKLLHLQKKQMRSQSNQLFEKVKMLTTKKIDLTKRFTDMSGKTKNLRKKIGMKINSRRIELLNGARIVCATLSACGVPFFRDLSHGFDTVIIDESTQSVELSCLIPLQYGCRRCILVGDPQQLPATVISNVANDFQYSRSLFERLLPHCGDFCMLRTQYRMHPLISQFPSSYFYEGKVKDGFEKAISVFEDHPVLQPFTFFDLQEGRESVAGHSHYNTAEAKFTVMLCSYLKRCTETQRKSLGVITPYQRQVTAISTIAKSWSLSVDVRSIDSFQGQEKDIIIVSSVRSRGKSRRSTIGFVADIRRLNVALTRAKSLMFVVGSAKTLCGNPAWGALIEDSASRRCLVRVKSSHSFFEALESNDLPLLKSFIYIKSSLKKRQRVEQKDGGLKKGPKKSKRANHEPKVNISMKSKIDHSPSEEKKKVDSVKRVDRQKTKKDCTGRKNSSLSDVIKRQVSVNSSKKENGSKHSHDDDDLKKATGSIDSSSTIKKNIDSRHSSRNSEKYNNESRSGSSYQSFKKRRDSSLDHDEIPASRSLPQTRRAPARASGQDRDQPVGKSSSSSARKITTLSSRAVSDSLEAQVEREQSSRRESSHRRRSYSRERSYRNRDYDNRRDGQYNDDDRRYSDKDMRYNKDKRYNDDDRRYNDKDKRYNDDDRRYSDDRRSNDNRSERGVYKKKKWCRRS